MGDKLTYEDLRQMPDDGWRYELLEGDIVASPAPTYRHQRIVFKLGAFLAQAEAMGAGSAVTAPTDVVLDPELNALEPDLLFIARERLGDIVTEANVRGAPDLVIEVLSPGSARYDLGGKRQVYARYGVRHYWVVDPYAGNVRTYVLGPGGYGPPTILEGDQPLGCPLFPGVTIPVARLFAD
jgi:Uma2 family endonuclease